MKSEVRTEQGRLFKVYTPCLCEAFKGGIPPLYILKNQFQVQHHHRHLSLLVCIQPYRC